MSDLRDDLSAADPDFVDWFDSYDSEWEDRYRYAIFAVYAGWRAGKNLIINGGQDFINRRAHA